MRRPLQRTAEFCAFLFFALSSVAFARPTTKDPYVTDVASIVLPDGRPGELFVLRSRGDAIKTPTVFWLLVVDQHKRLLARSREHEHLSLFCAFGGKTCRGYDHVNDEVLEIDPVGLRADGPTIPLTRFGEDVWPVGKSEKLGNFKVRLATNAEWFGAQVGLISSRPLLFSLFALIGAACAAFGTVGVGLPEQRNVWRIGFWLVELLLRLSLCGVFLIVAWLSVLTLTMTNASVLAGLSLGATLFFAGRRLWARRRTIGAT